MSELIPAATVIPLRDVDTRAGASTQLEVLMLRKNATLGFGGMWVFPGGRIDPDDDDPASPGDELAAARRAAVREALEEADLLVEPGGLVPFSHWTPPDVTLHGPKRFATWFFACRAPGGEAGVVTIDGGEIHADEWVRPADMLRRRDEGEIDLAPPTVVTLHELAGHDDVDSVLAAAAARTPFRYQTRIGELDGALVTMWGGDAGYESGDATADGPRHRLVMGETPWTFECTVGDA